MNHGVKDMKDLRQQGFTLIELMVTMVIALVILGGLVYSFTQQNTEYNYQNKRIDAVQDLEFTLRFMADDLRAGLIKGAAVGVVEPNPVENAAFTGVTATTSFTFWVWNPGLSDSVGAVDATTDKAERKYVWDSASSSLRYDRMVNTMNAAGGLVARSDNTATAAGEILKNITFFKIFRDDVNVASRASFTGIPAPLQSLTMNDSTNTGALSPGYTILIEMAVDAGYKNSSFLDVNGVDVRTTADRRVRVWRYIQVHPGTAVQ